MLTYSYLHHYCQLSLAVFCLLATLPAQAQFGLALSPMRVELNLTPGSQHTGSLAIGNSDVDAGRFRTEILDVSIDKEGVPQFEKEIASENDFSCKHWVTV